MIRFRVLLGILLLHTDVNLSIKLRSLLGKGTAQEPGYGEDVTQLPRNTNWRLIQIEARLQLEEMNEDEQVWDRLLEENQPLLADRINEKRKCCNCCLKCRQRQFRRKCCNQCIECCDLCYKCCIFCLGISIIGCMLVMFILKVIMLVIFLMSN